MECIILARAVQKFQLLSAIDSAQQLPEAPGAFKHKGVVPGLHDKERVADVFHS